MAEILFHVSKERRDLLQVKDLKAVEQMELGKEPSVTALVSILSKFLMQGETYVEPAAALSLLDELTLAELKQTVELVTQQLQEMAVPPQNGSE